MRTTWGLLALLLLGCPPEDVDEGVDADGDGFLSEASGGEDCDDDDAAVNPDAVEVCNGIDDDCDHFADDGTTQRFYEDRDGDGFGSDKTTEGCAPPEGFAVETGDCDDGDATISPAGTEVCDVVDQNCDGFADEFLAREFFADADGDGFGDPSASEIACEAPDGFVEDASDCDDDAADVSPDGVETCDERDEDCDGEVDEGLTTGRVFHLDDDGDGFGDPTNAVEACIGPSDHVVDGTDCDDADPAVNPAAMEDPCNALDDDCDAEIDEAGEDGREVGCEAS